MILSCVIMLLHIVAVEQEWSKKVGRKLDNKTQWKKIVRALDSMPTVYDVQTISK